MSRYSPPAEGDSVVQVLADLTSDVETLFRQETELAKTEMREEATRAGKAAGMFGGAGFAGYLVVIFLSLAGMFALDLVLPLVFAALIVAGAWALIGLVLAAVGRQEMRAVSPTPNQTVETLKEDAKWARHPTS
ncbi:phage holin family protein [Streptomyces hoynatensis]|uniref:Phage holin family protein n=1 Tax=Streptomyces hoynatensis TaxID=1141874 RepID=A0A3A9ZG94_9ACTN|nr:phage holin family protein [Streptomyces hoynatensis]RKN47159.1 phage holin family protein [Streptomyces hoynatensis]